MLNLAQQLAPLGQNIYPFVVDYIPGLKQSDKIKLKQALTPPQISPEQAAEQKKQQDAIQQVLVEGEKARINKDMTQSQLNIANVQVKDVEVEKTQAEMIRILAEAEQKKLENYQIRNGTRT